jgi:integrase/recombinase XerD
MVSAGTTRRRAASLRKFGMSLNIKILEETKLPVVGEREPHPLPGLKTDLDNMLDACTTDNQRALIACLGLEGMRLHEALGLELDKMDMKKRTMRIWGKGAKVRTVPITERALDYIAPQYIVRTIGRFSTLIDYSDGGARAFITALGEKAGVERPVSSHDLRATFATLAYEASSHDIRLVQAWLGHSSIVTTQGYIGTKMEDMRDAGNF